MVGKEMIELKRDCDAVQIPSGNPVRLPAGTRVVISQTLGGSFTVITDEGFMVRIEGKNADAIGREPVQTSEPQAAPGCQEDVEKGVWEAMRTCYDPEIPVNIAELGLIYDCRVASLEEGEYSVAIKMTLTAPGCGMGGMLAEDVKSKVLAIPGVREAQVELVWDPPWNPSMMSEAAKLELGFM